ncbi:hypothetical protein [Methylocaldum sp.]|uniref:hypothetical protein n=1 Tax=Methylocaldum sp. TaxID=1969727 RepID=UPI002D34F0FA|nr:hypothetical protein [Methylocaldum sp.]HYE35375.1 hypothetical protein [Methylocaldum sp.]
MRKHFFLPDDATKQEFGCLFFAVAPIGILLTAIVVFELGGFGLSTIPGKLAHQIFAFDCDVIMELSELRARMVWLTAVLVYYVIAVAVAVVSIYTIRLNMSRQCFTYFGVIIVLLGVLSVAYFVFGALRENSVNAIFQLTYGVLEASGYFSSLQLAVILGLVGVVNLIATVAPFAIVLAGSSALAPFKELPPDEVLYLLEGRFSHLKNAVNLGSAMLLIGVLHMLAWLRWPVVFLGDGKLEDEVVNWSLTLSMYWGAVFSLMVIALYVPCTLALYARAKREFNRNFPTSEHPELGKYLETFGISRDPMRQLPQVIAMLAPFIGGSLGASLANLGGVSG